MFNQYCPESQTLKQKLASASVPQNSRKKFLYKLFNLLEGNTCPHIISWSDDGQKVMLKNSFLLTEQILSTLFSHCNYSSFIRQFHFYQFKRVICDAQSIQAYQHPHFQRGKPDLLVLVQRVTKADKNDKKEVKTEFSEHRSEIERLKMEKAHNDLRQKTLSEELQRALEAIEMLKSQNMLLKDKIQNDQRYLERANSQVNFISNEEALFYAPTLNLQVSVKKAENVSEPTFITYSGSCNPDSSAITLTSESTPSEETEPQESVNQMPDTIAYLPPLTEWTRKCSIQNDYNLHEKHEELELEIGLSLYRPISFGKWNSNFFLGL